MRSNQSGVAPTGSTPLPCSVTVSIGACLVPLLFLSSAFRQTSGSVLMVLAILFTMVCPLECKHVGCRSN